MSNSDKVKQVLDKLDGLNPRGTCYFIFHDWEKWQTIDTGSISIGKSIIGRYETQRRECRNCGKVALREQKSCIR